MWYEILPGFGIICGCVVASGLAIKTIDKLFHGKVRRYNVDALDTMLTRRDKRLTQSEYIQKGLDNLKTD
ncbi:Hypothetical predicted protein [Paramuricea clavata]|uniref:NADH dehydrogenase [ubiquinone] 1 alpha subcomplex subunit 1 n=1 Tax=Paramuricea clavata TaxID=317549 RepID=A0A7D9I6S1_PARCT|nr:Hypothetical predicted protein [Paramuricea clavata]